MNAAPAVLALSLALLSLSCHSTPSEPEPPRLLLQERPPSAYAALVRALEVVDALRAPEVEVLVRAVESDSLFDRRDGTEYVRVVLDLTVLAPDYERASAMHKDLGAALQAEGRALARVEEVAPLRAERVFDHMDWTPLDGAGDTGPFEHLVSISGALRLEARRPLGADLVAADAASEGDALLATAGTSSMDAYIDAAAEGDGIGPVRVDTRVVPGSADQPGTSDIRFRIRPEPEDRPLDRARIGHFLRALEAGSPGVRLTHLVIQRVDTGLGDAWTFEADASLRVAESD